MPRPSPITRRQQEGLRGAIIRKLPAYMDVLDKHIRGEREISMARSRAIFGLLDKCIPSLSAVAFEDNTGDGDIDAGGKLKRIQAILSAYPELASLAGLKVVPATGETIEAEVEGDSTESVQEPVQIEHNPDNQESTT